MVCHVVNHGDLHLGLALAASNVLGVGAELGYYTTEGGLLFPAAEVVRIDFEQPVDGIDPRARAMHPCSALPRDCC